MPAALFASTFIASALVLVPLPWHWRVRNVPTLSIIAWLFVSCLSAGVNAIIWAGNTDLVIPGVWCDIVTKLKVGANIALPSCCLCLGLQLYAIASSLKTPKRGGGGVAIDLSLCWGLPILTMALHYIVQGHRFDVIEDFGCRPTIYISLLSLLLVDLPPVFVSLLALIYCGLALFYFSRRRLVFTSIFKNTASDSALSTSRYLRLMSMTMVLGTWNATIISIGVFATYSDGLRPWTSWSDVHSNFSRIQFYSLDRLSNGPLVFTYLLWAAVPISSLLFFAFFSFGEDSKKEYGRLFRWIRGCVLQQYGASRSRSSPVRNKATTPANFGERLEDPFAGEPLPSTGPFLQFYYQDGYDRDSSHSVTTTTSSVMLLPAERPPTTENELSAPFEFWAI